MSDSYSIDRGLVISDLHWGPCTSLFTGISKVLLIHYELYVNGSSDHYFHSYLPKLSVRTWPHFIKYCDTKQISSENIDRYWQNVSLAEGIIDDTCLTSKNQFLLCTSQTVPHDHHLSCGYHILCYEIIQKLIF